MARHVEGRRWVLVLAGVRRVGRSVARMRVQQGHVACARHGKPVQGVVRGGAGLQGIRHGGATAVRRRRTRSGHLGCITGDAN